MGWSWAEFGALPQTELKTDIHCVTKWTKLDTHWRGVTFDDLLRAAGIAPPSAFLMARCDGDYAANVPVADLVGGKAMVATHFEGEPLPAAQSEGSCEDGKVRPNGRAVMMDDVMPLDGNAAAGRLADLFAVEMTRAMIVCDSCGREAALAMLRLYGGAGLVLRCPGCDTVILRMMNTGATLSLDMRGCSRLTVQAPRRDAGIS